jgi:hypothetical protein
MVKCEACQWVGDELELIWVAVGLADDAWGAGESFVRECHCPECGDYDFLTDGYICSKCDEFIANGEVCDFCIERDLDES